MGAPTVEVADGVALELQPVHHHGFGVLGFLFFALSSPLSLSFDFAASSSSGVGSRSTSTKRLLSGAQSEVNYVLRRVGQLLRLAALSVQHPDLRLAVVARREKRKIFAVGAPAGV
jgi:hypothetical protein